MLRGCAIELQLTELQQALRDAVAAEMRSSLRAAVAEDAGRVAVLEAPLPACGAALVEQSKAARRCTLSLSLLSSEPCQRAAQVCTHASILCARCNCLL